METIPYVGAEFVKNHLSYAELIPAVRRALQEYSSNRSVQPLRTAVSVPEANGTLLTMPSYSSTDRTLMTKLIGLYPDNTKHNLPTHHCYITLFDENTGVLKCLMDGEIITAMRTAAATVVATQVVFEGKPRVLCIIGSGLQAKSHIAAFSEAYTFEKNTWNHTDLESSRRSVPHSEEVPDSKTETARTGAREKELLLYFSQQDDLSYCKDIEGLLLKMEVKIWGRDQKKAENVCSEFKHLVMENCKTIEDAVKDADVIVTVTHASEPILKGAWVKKGAHINCVGACRPTWRECDDECLTNATVYCDSEESALNESGDVILSKAEVYGEVGEVLLGIKPLRQAHHTFFKSLGLGLEDAVAANIVWKAVEAGDQRKS